MTKLVKISSKASHKILGVDPSSKEVLISISFDKFNDSQFNEIVNNIMGVTKWNKYWMFIITVF